MAAGRAREQLLDAAERVVLADGLEGLSIRRVTAAAGVNGAAVNYIFGSKQGLLGELIGRLAQPVTDERIRRFDRLAERPGAGAWVGAVARAGVDDIVRAFVEPLLSLPDPQRAALAALLHHSLASGELAFAHEVARHLQPGVDRLRGALRTLDPELDDTAIEFCIRLLTANLFVFEAVLRSQLGPAGTSENLIMFLAGGVRQVTAERC
jgi:AcrR family transcriptional regulator